MATKRTQAASKTLRTSPKNAGKPKEESAARSRSRSAAPQRPSSEELDIRDRLKSGPRRPAGPPLVGDVLTRAAIEALRNEVVPEPTDPTNLKRRS